MVYRMLGVNENEKKQFLDQSLLLSKEAVALDLRDGVSWRKIQKFLRNYSF